MRNEDDVSRQSQVLAARPDEGKKAAFARAASRAWAQAMTASSAEDIEADFKAATQLITRKIAEYERLPQHISQRRLRLRQFIDRVGPRVARDRDFPRHLIHAADRAHWPTWAVECLPSLFVRDEPDPGEPGRALVWHYLLDCVDPERGSIRHELCGGCVFEVELSGESLVLLDLLAPAFEECRMRRACPSLESMPECVLKVLEELIARGVPHATALRDRLLRGLYEATLSVEPQRKLEFEQELLVLQAQPARFPEWALSTLRYAVPACRLTV